MLLPKVEMTEIQIITIYPRLHCQFIGPMQTLKSSVASHPLILCNPLTLGLWSTMADMKQPHRSPFRLSQNPGVNSKEGLHV